MDGRNAETKPLRDRARVEVVGMHAVNSGSGFASFARRLGGPLRLHGQKSTHTTVYEVKSIFEKVSRYAILALVLLKRNLKVRYRWRHRHLLSWSQANWGGSSGSGERPCNYRGGPSQG